MSDIYFTYSQLFGMLRGGVTISHSKDETTLPSGVRLTKQLQILCHAEIAQFKDGKYSLHPKQIKPAISVVEILPKTAPSSGLGRVHVDWSGRGHSSGSYAVKADKGKFLEIAFELDVERVMTVAKERTKAAA